MIGDFPNRKELDLRGYFFGDVGVVGVVVVELDLDEDGFDGERDADVSCNGDGGKGMLMAISSVNGVNLGVEGRRVCTVSIRGGKLKLSYKN